MASHQHTSATPPPLKGKGSARKPLRYKGKGAQNLKNLCRKTEKQRKSGAQAEKACAKFS